MRVYRAVGTVAVLLGVLSGGRAAVAQDAAGGKELESLRQSIQKLQERIDQLEKAQKATPPAPAVTDDQIVKVVTDVAKKQEKTTDVLVSWKDGLNFQTRDGKVKMQLSGRMDLDAAWLDEDGDVRDYAYPMDPTKSIGDQSDGVEVRRLRLSVAGTILDNAFFKVEPDFAGTEKVVQKTDGEPEKIKTSTVALKDAYFGIRNLIPCAAIQAGHFKEPFSLEELTSDNYTMFMERGLPNAFSPSYNMGVQLSNAVLDERATWAAGAFRETDDSGYGVSEGGYNITSRVTGLPWYEEEGARLLHLGLSGSYRDLNEPTQTVQYRARPENHLASYFVDTNKMTAEHALLGDAEAALVLGPFSAQSELMQAQVDREDATNPTFWGGYLAASYFLTGEHRAYKKSAGCFDRVRPNQSFGETKDGRKGWGAWEVGARYSWLDLNDKSVKGGKLGDTTMGLNWYLNPNMRVMANYILADLRDTADSDGGLANIFGLRLHVDF